MKISKERFEEIISLYLDKEASPEELALLSKCVRGNQEMRNIWLRACRVHAATMNLYGKKADFIELDGVGHPFAKIKKPSKLRIAMEWTSVAALMMLSFGLFTYAISPSSDSENAQIQANISHQTQAFCANYDIKLNTTSSIDGEFCIMEISPKAENMAINRDK